LEDIKRGDVLIGLASSGVHSNGFSFVRRLVREAELRWSDPAPFAPALELGRALLEPTRIYVKPVLPLLRGDSPIKALAHITGSAHAGKLGRIIPDHLSACIELESWEAPSVFRWLRDESGARQDEMLRTFNCGIGMVAIVRERDAGSVEARLSATGLQVFRIGVIERRSEAGPVRFVGKLRFAS
jgi:phosphoribosylformylglycinamidine cyclo-ligase